MLQSDFHTFDLEVSPALASATQIHTNSKITWIMHPGTDRTPRHNLEYAPGEDIRTTWIMHPDTDRTPRHNLEYAPGEDLKTTWIMHPGTDRAPTHNLEYLPGEEQNSYTKRNTTTKQPLYSRFPTREVLLIKI